MRLTILWFKVQILKHESLFSDYSFLTCNISCTSHDVFENSDLYISVSTEVLEKCVW